MSVPTTVNAKAMYLENARARVRSRTPRGEGRRRDADKVAAWANVSKTGEMKEQLEKKEDELHYDGWRSPIRDKI